MDHIKWLIFVVNEVQRLARKSSTNFKTKSFSLIIKLLQKLDRRFVSSIFSSLVKKNFKKSLHLPQFWGKENG